MNYQLNNYEIKTETRELLYKGKPQHVEPLIFKLLLFMLENPDRVLSRDELIETIWESRVISDSALSASISAVRHALGDTGNKQNCIKTVSGSGYRFIANFTCVENDTAGLKLKEKAQPYKEEQKLLALPDKPSVAIMDFINIGSNENGVLLASGLTTEINSALARLPPFFVISRASASIISKQNLSSKEISGRLGVRYLVYGNLEQVEKRIRITFSVIDAVHNTEVWSEHFDRSLDDILQIQNDITNIVILATDAAIEHAEVERSFLVPTEDLSAWENYYRGSWHKNQTTLNDMDQAQHYFKKALSLDSRFSRAYASLAYTQLSHELLKNKPSLDDTEIKKALSNAMLSVNLDRHESMGYMSQGRALFFAKEYKQSLAMLDQGISQNPNYFHCHSIKGTVAAHLGRDAEAQQHLDIAERLSPLDPLQFYIKMARAITLVNQKRYDEAADCSLQGTTYPNAYFTTYVVAAACLQLAGRDKQAQQYTQQALKIKPDYSVNLYQSRSPNKNKRENSVFIKAMLDAGIPQESLA